MKQYIVNGMSYAACSARVEKAVSKLPEVEKLFCEFVDKFHDNRRKRVLGRSNKGSGGSGYSAQLKEEENKPIFNEQEELLKDKETPMLRKRFLISLCFLPPLMYVSMGHMMWNWPLPYFFSNNPMAIGLFQLLLTLAIMVINQKFFISGCKSLIHGAPNMDTLVSLGAGASFVYSLYVLFAMTRVKVTEHPEQAMAYLHELYFESAAMILTLITLGKMLESYSKGKTTNAIKSLMDLAPKTATLIKAGKEVIVNVEDVKVGDIYTVKPGENIPVDGIVVEGLSAVDESALTGESIPVDKKEGDTVSPVTINQSGFLSCQATRVWEDTTLSQIIQMVSDATATKAPIAKIADKVSGIFVPAVMLICVITFIIWMLAGASVGLALARAISVLVISCLCALGLATSVAIMVGNGRGAKSGIMYKTAEVLEQAGKTDIVVLDKTPEPLPRVSRK